MSAETPDDKVHEAEREVRRNRLAKWAWFLVLSPPAIVGYLLLDFETFVKVTSLVTLELSIIALSLANHAAQKGAEAKAAGYDNP
jgi:hypothetical protein